MVGPQFTLSQTVKSVRDNDEAKQSVNAVRFTQLILESFDHLTRYAKGLFLNITLEDTPTSKFAQEWIDEIQELLDLNKFNQLKDPSEPHLNGRLAILCLCLLDSQLYQQCERVRIFTALLVEHRPPLLKILNERGRKLYDSLPKEESVSTILDDPLTDPKQDLLGRGAFARYLAERIKSVQLDFGAYNIHIYAPWGAGKSTLLNFIRSELERKENIPIFKKIINKLKPNKNGEWLVVEFNAWRNQHIQPPWWSLMDHIYRNTKKKLNPIERFLEFWWRFNTGRMHIWIALIVSTWILTLYIIPQLGESNNNIVWGLSADVAENISKIIALISTIWGVIFGISRALLLGSAKAAKNYSELTQDPTGEIKERFNNLINRLKPFRVVIFIDDLDRCQSQYVVDLLEGIQTLFREAPVVFLVASDRKWLNACYELVYEELEPIVGEFGKPLGILFLEKAFRLSTPMPSIPETLKMQYWENLLQVRSSDREIDLEKERNEAKDLVDKASNELEVRNLAKYKTERSFVRNRVIVEEAVVKLATPEIHERLEHTLKPYSDLLDPNPRAMKRLVNAYSAYRALSLLSQNDIDPHQLVLGTIFSMRWPQLADHLADNYEESKKEEPPEIDNLPEELKGLFREVEVTAVIQGGSRKEPLKSETLWKISVMRA